MSLPPTHPYLLQTAGGSDVGNVNFKPYLGAYPDRYTRQAANVWTGSGGFPWRFRTGSTLPATGLDLPFLTTTPGGRGALDISRGSCVAFNDVVFPLGFRAFTVDGWFRPTGWGGGSDVYIWSDTSGGGGNQYITIGGGATGGSSIRVTVRSNMVFDVSVDGTVPRSWTHLALQWGRATPPAVSGACALYVNGQFFGSRSGTINGPTTRASHNLFLQSSSQLGDWKIYTRVLDASDILQSYNTMAPVYGRPVIPV